MLQLLQIEPKSYPSAKITFPSQVDAVIIFPVKLTSVYISIPIFFVSVTSNGDNVVFVRFSISILSASKLLH